MCPAKTQISLTDAQDDRFESFAGCTGHFAVFFRAAAHLFIKMSKTHKGPIISYMICLQIQRLVTFCREPIDYWSEICNFNLATNWWTLDFL